MIDYKNPPPSYASGVPTLPASSFYEQIRPASCHKETACQSKGNMFIMTLISRSGAFLESGLSGMTLASIPNMFS
jgi:hypothetical protein